MLVTDSFANAQEYAERAITIMAQKGIPATPQNYTLWYDYVSDRNPELKIAIDEIIKVDDQFPSNVCSEFYEKFYLSNEQQGRQNEEPRRKQRGIK